MILSCEVFLSKKFQHRSRLSAIVRRNCSEGETLSAVALREGGN